MDWKLVTISLLLTAACNKSETPTASAQKPALSQPNATSTSQADPVIRALSVRDPEPTCSSVEALMGAEPAVEWLRIVDEVSMPPWVPMRAANCILMEHAGASEAAIIRWVVEPELQGLGILTMNHLSDLPENVAINVATAALSGPRAAEAEVRVSHDQRPAIRSLVSK